MNMMRTIRTVSALAASAMLITVATLEGADSGASSSTTAITSLNVDHVVDNLVRMNQERAKALLHSEATRVYHLVYHGFPGDREAELTVETYVQ